MHRMPRGRAGQGTGSSLKFFCERMKWQYTSQENYLAVFPIHRVANRLGERRDEARPNLHGLLFCPNPFVSEMER